MFQEFKIKNEEKLKEYYRDYYMKDFISFDEFSWREYSQLVISKEGKKLSELSKKYGIN